ncbi:aspartic proteinase NANA, chloroplast [Vigna unguiculata]|uniref:aspartic proteinase NANA, chloroplast n=1 Tax=Vigna unguiculata TaxID=3917 RepID=UPI001016081F|nr:aspartic proteinase NANA, chloroplast [Vigna unguiculata]
MGRMMQWNKTNNSNNMFKVSILLTFTLLLFSLPAPVHGATLALVHRNHDRFTGGKMDRLEAVKGFVQRDNHRRLQINQRLGYDDDHDTRRRAAETDEAEMPLLTGRDLGIGEYFVEVKVGTPGQKLWLAADTGSEFTWFNCLSLKKTDIPHQRPKKKHPHHARSHHHKTTKNHTKAKKKAKNHKNDPCTGVYCPDKSRTFHSVTCASRKCKVDLSDLFSLTYCPNPSDPCLYDIGYADGSSAKGFFGTDTIILNGANGKQEKLNNLTVGCTKEMLDGINFNEETGGILGLGFVKDSFIDKACSKYGSIFSYCLVDHLSHRDVPSYLTFGGHHRAKLQAEMKKTELILFPPFYGVNVVGMSVGNQMLNITPEVWNFNTQGGTIVDSGTTLTALLTPAYEAVSEALTKPLSSVKKIPAEDFGALDFCFEGDGFDEKIVPRLAFHFAGGVKFEPPVKSYIIDVAPQVKCLGIVPIMGAAGVNVIGNIMQQDHLWQYDFAKRTVGFAPSLCS